MPTARSIDCAAQASAHAYKGSRCLVAEKNSLRTSLCVSHVSPPYTVLSICSSHIELIERGRGPLLLLEVPRAQTFPVSKRRTRRTESQQDNSSIPWAPATHPISFRQVLFSDQIGPSGNGNASVAPQIGVKSFRDWGRHSQFHVVLFRAQSRSNEVSCGHTSAQNAGTPVGSPEQHSVSFPSPEFAFFWQIGDLEVLRTEWIDIVRVQK